MTNSLVINNHVLSVREYQGKRVVTFNDIDRVHGRTLGTASRNFKNNREHFVKGQDYFVLKRNENSMDEFRPLKIPPKGITLITESGYLMLCKSFGDKLAWDIQRKLVDTYFHKKEFPEQLTVKETAYPQSFSSNYSAEVINAIRKQMNAINVLLDRYCPGDEKFAFPVRTSVWMLALDISTKIHDLGPVLEK